MEQQKVYGYARVSSNDQNESRQIQALDDYGITKDRIFVDKVSGKDFNRQEYQTLGTFISDLILQILSFVAEQERRNIRTRQAEGIAIAKSKNVKFGRPPIKVPDNFVDVCTRWNNGEITATEAINLTGLKRTN